MVRRGTQGPKGSGAGGSRDRRGGMCGAHGQCLRANRGKRGSSPRVLCGARIPQPQSKLQPSSAASRHPNKAALAAPILRPRLAIYRRVFAPLGALCSADHSGPTWLSFFQQYFGPFLGRGGVRRGRAFAALAAHAAQANSFVPRQIVTWDRRSTKLPVHAQSSRHVAVTVAPSASCFLGGSRGE